MRIRSGLEFLLWGAVVHASMAMAQTPGMFTATGNMTTPRIGHTATLLPNGRVLIAGGEDGVSNSAQASAELYDPVTGTFIPTGSMTTSHTGHSATMLPNGQVLIAGGGPRSNCGCISAVASAELYDPATGTFAPTGAMTVERQLHTATLLNNGKVLIAGGIRTVMVGSDSQVRLLASAELYDPATGIFTATGDMHEPYSDTATLLPNGKVLITRGYYYDAQADLITSSATPNSTTLRPAPLPSWETRSRTISVATATPLMNGKVLIAGGGTDFPTGSTELYDPATGAFTMTGSLVTAREQDAATLLSRRHRIGRRRTLGPPQRRAL